MEKEKAIAISRILMVVGILVFILVFIFQENTAAWILVSIILLIISVVLDCIRRGRSKLMVVMIILVQFEVWAFFQIILFNYPQLGTVVSG